MPFTTIFPAQEMRSLTTRLELEIEISLHSRTLVVMVPPTLIVPALSVPAQSMLPPLSVVTVPFTVMDGAVRNPLLFIMIDFFDSNGRVYTLLLFSSHSP